MKVPYEIGDRVRVKLSEKSKDCEFGTIVDIQDIFGYLIKFDKNPEHPVYYPQSKLVKLVKFWLKGCDISFMAEAPQDITLKQLLKQCDKIVPEWCDCGIGSIEEEDKNEIPQLLINYNKIVKTSDDVCCEIKED